MSTGPVDPQGSPMIRSVDEALAYLASFTDYEQKDAAKLGRRSLDLERMRSLMEELGRPADGICCAHVAGSKGKGSTSMILREICTGLGARTGLFLSPHLSRVNERISIDGVSVSDERFAELVRKLAAVVEPNRDKAPLDLPSFFESLAAMAWLEFRRSGVDVAVVEVGLGGRLDATNVVDGDVTVITPLDLEHTRVLGSTLEEIAAEKAGIIKPGRPVITSVRSNSPGASVIRQRARKLGCDAYFLDRDFALENIRHLEGRGVAFDLDLGPVSLKDLELGVDGRHQAENAALALAAAWILGRRGRLTWCEDRVRESLRRVNLPGRLEALDSARLNHQAQPLPYRLLLDTAHTPVSMEALGRWIDRRAPDGHRLLLLGMLQDKRVGDCLEALRGRIDEIWTVAPDSPRATDPHVLGAAVLDDFHDIPVRVVDGGPEALVPLLPGIEADLVAVAGSVYLTGALRVHLDVDEGPRPSEAP